jgi:hypothetical protein
MKSPVPPDEVSPSAAAATRRPSLARVAAVGFGRGLLSGLVATAAMSAAMLAAQKSGLLGRMPPRRITDRFLDLAGVGRTTPEPARRALAAVSHFAFGGACGALLGIASEVYRARVGKGSARRARTPLIAAGLAYGTAIWAVSYAGWVPAVGAMPAPPRDRPGRQPSMVLAHWIYGAVLGRLLA